MYGKRFTHNRQWITPRFRKLSPDEKLVYLYLVDHVDWAGFIPLDEDRIAFDVGLEKDSVHEALMELNTDEIIIHQETIFFLDFIEEQKNTPINPKDNSHKAIIKSLDLYDDTISECLRIKNNLDPHLTLVRGSGNGSGKAIGNSSGKKESRDLKVTGKDLFIWNQNFNCNVCNAKKNDQCKSRIEGGCSFPEKCKGF